MHCLVHGAVVVMAAGMAVVVAGTRVRR
jgi:hypothetical protein